MGEEFDVVSYIALGRHRGKFLHLSAEGAVTVVDVPNTYAEVGPERRTVILKIHGGVGPRARAGVGQLRRQRGRLHRLPRRSRISPAPSRSGSPRGCAGATSCSSATRFAQWYVRVFLHRLWQHESPTYHSWAVQPSVDPPELASWRRLGIDVFEVAPDEYAAELRRRLAAEVPDRA